MNITKILLLHQKLNTIYLVVRTSYYWNQLYSYCTNKSMLLWYFRSIPFINNAVLYYCVWYTVMTMGLCFRC